MFVPKLNKNNFVRKRQQANRLFHIRDNNDFLWKISQSEQKMEKHHYFDDYEDDDYFTSHEMEDL